jgi:hypothetical protein
MSGRPIVAGSPYHELVKPIRRTTKVALILEIFAAYARVRVLMWRHDLPSVVAALRNGRQLSTDRRLQAIGHRLGHAVERTLRFVPFDSRCLVRSLVLLSLLSRRDISSTLVIGGEVAPSFSAHAWVESGGRALLSPLPDECRVAEL